MLDKFKYEKKRNKGIKKLIEKVNNQLFLELGQQLERSIVNQITFMDQNHKTANKGDVLNLTYSVELKDEAGRYDIKISITESVIL